MFICLGVYDSAKEISAKPAFNNGEMKKDYSSARFLTEIN